MKPTIGRIVIYRTDGRNGLVYDLPAIITCTADTHPGDYLDGSSNPLPVPESDDHIHLTVFTPGGFGSYVEGEDGLEGDERFVGAPSFKPGSGTYVEWNVPAWNPVGTETLKHEFGDNSMVPARSWRWPVRA